MTVAAPSTIGGLLLALQERVGELVKSLSLETKTEGVRRAPVVHLFDLPPKGTADAEQFPFLVVRTKAGTDTVQGGDENAMAGIEIVIGAYSDTSRGGLDVLVLIDLVRFDLGAGPAIAGTAYEHIGPLTWETPAQQPRPEWFGFINTNWQIPRPTRVDARNPMSEV